MLSVINFHSCLLFVRADFLIRFRWWSMSRILVRPQSAFNGSRKDWRMRFRFFFSKTTRKPLFRSACLNRRKQWLNSRKKPNERVAHKTKHFTEQIPVFRKTAAINRVLCVWCGLCWMLSISFNSQWAAPQFIIAKRYTRKHKFALHWQPLFFESLMINNTESHALCYTRGGIPNYISPFWFSDENDTLTHKTQFIPIHAKLERMLRIQVGCALAEITVKGQNNETVCREKATTEYLPILAVEWFELAVVASHYRNEWLTAISCEIEQKLKFSWINVYDLQICLSPLHHQYLTATTIANRHLHSRQTETAIAFGQMQPQFKPQSYFSLSSLTFFRAVLNRRITSIKK